MFECIKGHEVKVLKSGAGHYIGTVDKEDGFPYCRISENYWKKAEEAQKQLDGQVWMDRRSSEVQYCNGGCGCRIRKVEDK
jgi:hypothetical protein